MRTKVETQNLDEDWIALIIEAKKMGLNRKEIRSFLRCDPN